MRKIVLALVLSTSLAGCATFQKIGSAISIGTASIANPVTKTRLNQMEAAMRLVFSGLEAWKESCEQGNIPADCRQQINEVQVYTQQYPPYLLRLRTFVKTHDQVNAIAVFNEIVDLARIIKARAAAGGVSITTTVGS